MRKPRSSKDFCDAGELKFIELVLRGSTQAKAYAKVYGSCNEGKKVNMTQMALYGCKLWNQPKCVEAREKIQAVIQKEAEERCEWTASQSIRTLRKIIDSVSNEMDRINEAFEEELDQLDEILESENDPQKFQKALIAARELRKKRRISKIHTEAIINASSELNKMQGFNQLNVNGNVSNLVMFQGEDDILD